MNLRNDTDNCIVSMLVHDEKRRDDTKLCELRQLLHCKRLMLLNRKNEFTPTLVMNTMRGNPLQTKNGPIDWILERIMPPVKPMKKAILTQIG